MSASPITAPAEPRAQLIATRRISPAARSADRFYRPELDVLRLFAFLCVFLHHGLPGFEQSHHHGMAFVVHGLEVIQKSGGFGVCLFFVLSAYLITELVRREHARVGTVHVKSFYIRRILRIWPLYFFFLFTIFGLGTVIPALHIEVLRFCAFVFLAGNWYLNTASFGNIGNGGIGILWSISLEEQFYLAWPCIAKVGGRRAIIALSIALFPIAWIVLAVMSWMGCDSITIWVNSLVQFQFFGLGALLALGLNGKTPQMNGAQRILLAGVGLGFWLVAAGVFHIKELSAPSLSFLIAGYAFVAAGCACLLIAVLGITRLLSPKLVFLGKISYGLYVFHRIAQICTAKILLPSGFLPSSWSFSHKFAQLVSEQIVALGATVLLAIVSYRFLETPFLKLKERFAFVKSRSA